MPLVETASWVRIAQQAARDHIQKACPPCQRGEARGRCYALHLDVAGALSRGISWPHRVTLRGLVLGTRLLKITGDGLGAWKVPKGGEVIMQQLLPDRFGADAYHATGGILYAAVEPLERGSVVELACEMLDPISYNLRPWGIIVNPESVRVVVGVRK